MLLEEATVLGPEAAVLLDEAMVLGEEAKVLLDERREEYSGT